MNSLTLSPKYQIVIPKKIRDVMQLHTGEKLQIFKYDNRIELIPVREIRNIKGILSGIDTKIIREKDRI